MGAPETIWATPYDEEYDTGTYCPPQPHMNGGPPNGDAIQYTRSDLIPQWQPIETAPRIDEFRCLLSLASGDVVVGEFVTTNVDTPYWAEVIGSACEYTSVYPEPTHWQPLPISPS